MQDSIKQPKTYTTIATTNVEATVSVMNGSSIQTQVYRHVDTTNTYSYSYSYSKFKIKVHNS